MTILMAYGRGNGLFKGGYFKNYYNLYYRLDCRGYLVEVVTIHSIMIPTNIHSNIK